MLHPTRAIKVRNRTVSPCPLTVSFALIFLAGMVTATCALDSDGCDWRGSGFDVPDGRSVRPIRLQCSQGRVIWTHPRGAVRLELRNPTADQQFKVCVKLTAPLHGARLYAEGHRTLVPLATAEDGVDVERLRCFEARGASTAIYVEAEPVPAAALPPSGARQAAFMYEVSADHNHERLQDHPHAAEECRPCTDAELVEAFCTSGFVARGKITRTKHDEASDSHHLTVAANEVFRQAGERVFPVSADTAGRRTGTLAFPGGCGLRPPSPGAGEFVFMGTVRLGAARVRCAPTLAEWTRTMRRAEESGTAVCPLAA